MATRKKPEDNSVSGILKLAESVQNGRLNGAYTRAARLRHFARRVEEMLKKENDEDLNQSVGSFPDAVSKKIDAYEDVLNRLDGVRFAGKEYKPLIEESRMAEHKLEGEVQTLCDILTFKLPLILHENLES